MADCIERGPLLEAFKAKCCEDCPGGYDRAKCHSWCDAADEIALVEDAPAVVPDAQRWRKTAEEPPTEKDSAHGNVLVKYMDATFAQSATWDTVASAPDLFTLWMPMPELPKGVKCENRPR